MRKEYVMSALTASLLTTSLLGEPTRLESVYITTTSFKTEESKATNAVEIYTKKDIEDSNAKDIYEFLNSSTSIITMPSYGNSFTQKIDMRGYGLDSGYQNIVITVDGRRVNSIDMTPPLLSSIAIEDIEQIEIIKGGGAVEFGDGANAGD